MGMDTVNTGYNGYTGYTDYTTYKAYICIQLHITIRSNRY